MATPKAVVQTASTPKNPHASTPSRPIASPRPNVGGVGGKTLAYKSPAVKTPSSIHGHSHRISISSHPTSTPVPAPAIHDELLNLNSPAAALIASIGNTGLTPMATGQDGLGITTGITPQAVRDVSLLSRNPEVEKIHRLEQVARLLKTKTAGHGVTRDGVEGLAQIQGFTILWDEDNLTIAGNSVDLEITFDSFDRDRVREVQLRLNFEGQEEPQLQKNASEVLKSHLMTADTSSFVGPWKSLQEFSHDLKYLSEMDYTDSTANCFEIMTGLYESFSNIWQEENQRLDGCRELKLTCRGNVGRPTMDAENRLGMTTEFWINKHIYKDSKNGIREPINEQEGLWIAAFACEKGTPGMIANRNWLGAEPLQPTAIEKDESHDMQIAKPNWSDFKGHIEPSKDADDMMLDGTSNMISETLDLVFSCQLDTHVLIPINVISELNNVYHMIHVDQRKALTYQQALFNEMESVSVQEWSPNTRWSRDLSFFDKNDRPDPKRYSFSLFANGVPWSYPVSELRFSHPKQFAEAIPVLRQYALLWSILRCTLVSNAQIEQSNSGSANHTSSIGSHGKKEVMRRSNKKAAEGQLEDILTSMKVTKDDTRIDMSLDLLTEPNKAKLEIIVPVTHSTKHDYGGRFLKVGVEVQRNGVIEVASLHGLDSINKEKMRQKASKVLRLAEDIAFLVAWLQNEIRAVG